MKILSIVIVNWNSREQLRECVASVIDAADDARAHAQVRIVVVDNASTDGSSDNLDAGPLELTVLRNQENRGFGAACNQGAWASPADYFLFLNPDTRLHRSSLTVPLKAAEDPAFEKIGIFGIQLIDEADRVARSCSRSPTAWRLFSHAIGLTRVVPSTGTAMAEWDHLSDREVDQVIGAFFFVRGQLFQELGGFDERFFVYFEEVDFAVRARQRGQGSLYLASTNAFHRGGGTTDQVKALRLFYSWRSRLQYAEKHFGAAARKATALTTEVIEPLVRVTRARLRGRSSEVEEVREAQFRLSEYRSQSS